MRELASAAIETVFKVDAELEGENKKNTVSEQENDKHSTCYS